MNYDHMFLILSDGLQIISIINYNQLSISIRFIALRITRVFDF